MEEKYHTTNIVKNILKNCPSYTTLKIEIVNEIIDYIENNIIVDSENNNNSLSISNISKSLNISVSLYKIYLIVNVL